MVDDEPWFRRTKPDGSPAAHATISDKGEILILDGAWAASFKHGRWHLGIHFSHEQVAEFSPVHDQEEVEQLVVQARNALDREPGGA